MKISKSGLIMLIIGLLAVGFASVSTTLILTGTVSVGVNKDDFEVVFASANIDGGHANISKTTKKGDTLTFSTPDISKVDEPVVLNYTVKNNSTQYGADVSIKCYAVNDTNHYLNDYITLTGVFGSQNITFGVDEASATLSGSETINAQGILSGSITVNLDKPFLGIDGKLSVACKIVANASEQTSAGVRPDNPLANNTEIESIKAENRNFYKAADNTKNYDYQITVADDVNEIELDVKTKNIYSDVLIGKEENVSSLNSMDGEYKVSLLTGSNIEYTKNKKVHLDSDENYFKVKIISEDESEESVYTIKVKRQEPVLLNTSVMYGNTLITSAPTLTKSSAAAGENGLYKSTATNSGKPTYYFRGNVQTNYLEFAGFDWRIMRINEDETTRLILSAGINNNEYYQFNSQSTGYNYYQLYYTNSDVAKPTVDAWYDENIQNKGYNNRVATGDYFCEQAKVKYDNNYSSGNASMLNYSSYTPNFKCATDAYGKGIVTDKIALPTYDEIMFAGVHIPTHSYSGYLNSNAYFATMSSNGVTSRQGEARLWTIRGNVCVSLTQFAYSPVINLNTDVRIIGTGVVDDPYIVQ